MRLVCGVVDLGSETHLGDTLTRMCASLQSAKQPATVTTFIGREAALAVLDFDGASAEPMNDSHGRVLAADLRLDYVDELRRDIPESASMSQTQLAAAVLASKNPNAASALHGDFACALWQPEHKELLLARDAFGVRPLCYAPAGAQRIVFASFPRAILASGLVTKQLDEEGILGKITGGRSSDRTLFAGISWLEAGCTLRWTAARSTLHRYWQAELQSIHHRTPEQAAEELAALVQAAVRTRMPHTGDVAAHMSGGLDSTTIAILLARMLQPEGRTLYGYSFLSAPEELDLEDESPFVNAALEQESSIYSIPVHAPKNSDPAPALPDELLSQHSQHPENVVCRDASARGVSLIFSGWGGDEGISYNGRASLADAFVHLRWAYLMREMRAMHHRRGIPYSQLLKGDIFGHILAERRLTARLLPRRDTVFKRVATLLQPEMQRKIAHRRDRLNAGSSVRRNQLELLRSPHIPTRNVHWAMYGAPFGVAFTFPYLDRRLIDFALSLPPTWQLRGGHRRRVIRDAMTGILPERIRWRDNKLAPFPPGAPSDEPNPAEIAALLDRAARNPVTCRIVDVGKLRAELLQSDSSRKQQQPHARIVMNLVRFLDQTFKDSPGGA